MASETAARFGQRMAQRRRELGLRQREVAKRIQEQVPEMGADKQRVSDWERGVNVPNDTYKPAIVKALEVPDVSYFYETPEPPPTPDLSEALPPAPTDIASLRAQLDQIQAELRDAAREFREFRKEVRDRYGAIDVIVRFAFEKSTGVSVKEARGEYGQEFLDQLRGKLEPPPGDAKDHPGEAA